MKASAVLPLLLLVALAAVCQAVKVPREMRALSKGLSLSSFMLRARNDAVCQNRTKSCADCHRVNVCAYVGSGYNFIMTNTCPDSAPYCEDGECARVPGEACASPAVANDFTCYDGDEFQGYYPAPFDCTKYYLCANSVPYVYNCPDGHIYDHSRAACLRRDVASAGACYTFPCQQSAQYLLYKPDEAVYAYCINSNRALVSKCPPNYRMNPEQPNEPCKPFCSRPGRIADHDNPRVYYDCNLLDVVVTSTMSTGVTSSPYDHSQLAEPLKQYCPPGMVFDDLTKRCVLDKQGTVTPSPSP